jgi:hypothetical protein
MSDTITHSVYEDIYKQYASDESTDYVLVKYDVTVGDADFDVTGLALIKLSDWLDLVENVRQHYANDGRVLADRFGESDFVEFDTFDDWVSSYSITLVRNGDYEVLSKYIRPGYNSSFYYPEDLETDEHIKWMEEHGYYSKQD